MSKSKETSYFYTKKKIYTKIEIKKFYKKKLIKIPRIERMLHTQINKIGEKFFDIFFIL